MTGFVAPEIAWGALTPILLVLGAAVAGVLVEAFVPRRARRRVQLALALAALAGALVAVAVLWGDVAETGGTDVLGGSVLVDGPTLVLQGTVALLALLAVLVVADRTSTGEDAFAPQGAAVPGSGYEEAARAAGLEQTEVYPLLLFATGGMLVFPATGDLLTLFVALEVLSLPLYLLTGLARRRRLLSQEASMKYFLLGSFASALLLFGIALLYGFAGSLRYAEIAEAVRSVSGMDGLLLTGGLLVLTGLLFKVGAVPFHSWTPDAYQGAPTPITGFMAACTKVAAFGALLRVLYVMLPDLRWDLEPALWTVAIATMAVGTVAALVQTDIKRVLAYSSVAHAGFVLTGVVALTASGVTGVLFYLLAYGAATVGAFGIVSLVRERGAVRADDGAPSAGAAVPALAGGGSVAAVAGGADARRGVAGGTDAPGAAGAPASAGRGADVLPGEPAGPVLGEATRLSQWAGLGRTHPVLAGTFALFLLSFAGIPLTAGFTGKFAVFAAAVEGGAWPLAVVGVVASAAAAFFYVRIIVLMFFTSPEGGPAGPAATDEAGTAGEDGSGTPDQDGAETVVQDGAAPERPGTVVVASQGFALVAIAACAVLTIALGVVPGPVLDAVADVARLLP